MTGTFHDCLIPEGSRIDPDVTIGPRVVLAGSDIVVRQGAKIDAAAVIGAGVVIGQGAWVRAGAVVLSSVPANAIVEGNPARVVGYCDGAGAGARQRRTPRYVDVESLNHLPRPARVDLGVGQSALHLMRRINDSRGALSVGEVPTEVPFAPARYFVVFDVPSLELRGEHAHRQCQQFLICLHGSCRVLLDDGENRCEVSLNHPDMGVFMPEMIWGTQYRYTSDAVLLVFASRTYEPEDYIRDYDEYLAAVRGCEP